VAIFSVFSALPNLLAEDLEGQDAVYLANGSSTKIVPLKGQKKHMCFFL